MRKRLMLFVVLTMLLTGTWPGTAAAAVPGRILTVTLTGVAGKPLAGAQVELLAPGVGIAAETRSTPGGRANLPVPPGESFWIRVWAQGYAVVDQPWVPLADGYTLSLALTAYAGSVTGLVSGREGLPVEGARVTAWEEGRGLVAEALTNGNGIYTLRGLAAPGPYQIQVEARGYAPQVSDPLNLTAGAQQRLDLDLTPADARVTGRVVDATSGRPLAGARVEALRSDWGIVAAVKTQGDGLFVLGLPGAENPEYRLRVWAPAYDLLTTEPFALAPGEWRSFSGGDRLALNLLQGEIWGIVLDDAGEGLDDMRVELQRAEVGTVAVTTTDEEGFYFFTGVVPGDYRVRAFPGASWAPSDSGWITAEPGVPVAADVMAIRYDGESYDDGIITGRVLGPGGEPVPEATLTLVRGNRTVDTTTTDERGFYRFTEVWANLGDAVPGTGYLIRVEAEGYYPTDLQQVEGERPTGLLDLQEGGVARADFYLHPAAGRLEGRVLDSQGNPVAEATVSLHRAGSGPVAETTTDLAGRYVFRNLEAPGGVTYLVTASAPGFYETVLGTDGQPHAPADPAQWPGGQMTVDLVLHPSQGQLHGAVANSRGEPLAGAQVTAVRPADGATWTGITDAGGWYVIPEVPVGPGDAYLVRAAAPGAPEAAASQVVEPAGSRAAAAHVAAAPSAAVAGTIYGADGNPVPGAAVELWQEGLGTPVARTTAGLDGSYGFDGLLAGHRYAVRAEAPGFQPTALRPGETVVTPLFTATADGTVQRHLALMPEVR